MTPAISSLSTPPGPSWPCLRRPNDLLEPGGGHQPLPDLVPTGSRWACQSPEPRLLRRRGTVTGCAPGAAMVTGNRAPCRAPELPRQGLGSTVPGLMDRAAMELRLWCPVPDEQAETT